MKEAQRKRRSGTHSNYKVEWLKDQISKLIYRSTLGMRI